MAAHTDRALVSRYCHDVLNMTWDRVGDLLGIDATTASRDAKSLDDVPESSQTAVDDLETLLATQELDDHASFKAGIARRLAVKLDKASVSDKAQDSQALPLIAKELDSLVNAIMDVSSDDKEWLAGLLVVQPCPKCGWSPDGGDV